MTALYIIGGILLILILIYNSLVRKRNQTENAFATIDTMLKKRFDLIPNLVTVVKQYAAHEQETFARITEMRSKAYDQLSSSEKSTFDEAFTRAGQAFTLIAESYPELKASGNFMQLQRTLNETEEQLAAARRTFNAAVTDYNNAVQTFPTNLLAGMFGFVRKDVLFAKEAERNVPEIKNL